jgi:hypothetical protein
MEAVASDNIGPILKRKILLSKILVWRNGNAINSVANCRVYISITDPVLPAWGFVGFPHFYQNVVTYLFVVWLIKLSVSQNKWLWVTGWLLNTILEMV